MIIPVCPVPAPRMTRSDAWKKRPCVMRYWEYRDKIKQHINDVPVPLNIHFCLPMPYGWTEKKKKMMLGSPHRQKPDIDNLLKGFLDAVLEDDAHIHTVTASKSWSSQGSIILGGTI